jgi:hypothetical protein
MTTRTPGCTCSLTRRAWRDDGTCARCGNRVLETQIQDIVLDTMIADPLCCLWRNNIGLSTHWPDGSRRISPIKYGVGNPGGADLLGLRAGVPLAVETKTVRGRLSPEQRAFARAWTDRVGVYAVVRSEDDTRALLAWLRGDGVRPGFVFAPGAG